MRAGWDEGRATAMNERDGQQQDGQADIYDEIDIETAYEHAGGDTWDDLLQYLESNPAEDFDALTKNDVRTMTEQVRSLMEEGREYPSSAEELRELLTSEAQIGSS